MGRTKQDLDKYGIPLMEIHKVLENDHQGILRYIITQHPLLPEFYLYKIENNKATKVDTQSHIPEFKKLEKERLIWRKELEKLDKENGVNAEN